MTSRVVRIGLVGDPRPSVRAHAAIPTALQLAASSLGIASEGVWLPTRSLGRMPDEALAPLSGVWCVPGSPYESMENALAAIRYARERGIPFLGTCGGFQHALIEFARHVLGLAQADHAESSPEAALPVVSALSCSLVGVRGQVELAPDSRAARAYGRTRATEAYHCNYGLNSRYQHLFDGSALHVTGRDEAGEARVVELAGHPFFVATLFQPELSAASGEVHPLVKAYVAAAAARS